MNSPPARFVSGTEQSELSDERKSSREGSERMMKLRGESPPVGGHAPAELVALWRNASDPDERVREQAVATIENAGEPDASASAELSDLVRPDEAPDTVYWAITLLGRIGANCPDEAAGTVAEALQKTFAIQVRQRAAWAMSRIGVRNEQIRERLSEAAGAADSRLARLAAAALDKS